MHYCLLLVSNVTVTVIYSKHGGLTEQLHYDSNDMYKRKKGAKLLTALHAPEHEFALHKGTRLVEFTLL